MRSRLLPLVIAAGFGCGCLSPSLAWGWGAEGHVTVAKIAELNLTPKARPEIRKILGPTSIADQRIATFADMVKHNKDFPQNGESGPWHFVDIPIDGEFDPAKHCKDGTCVIDQIERFQKVLAGNGPSADRLEALMFLVHLVGDIHQPLHCATRGNPGDRGGNALTVKLLGRSGQHMNLHSVWDSDLVRACMNQLEPADFAHRLNGSLTNQQRKNLAGGKPKDWALESNKLAKEKAYQFADGTDVPTDGHPNLPQTYVDEATKIVEQQLCKGGLRLAKLLNDALDPANAGPVGRK